MREVHCAGEWSLMSRAVYCANMPVAILDALHTYIILYLTGCSDLLRCKNFSKSRSYAICRKGRFLGPKDNEVLAKAAAGVRTKPSCST